MLKFLLVIFLFIFYVIISFLFFEAEIVDEIEILPVESDAKCLDGSEYKFQIIKGFDKGANNFLIYFQGGAWCGVNESIIESCQRRSKYFLGNNKIPSPFIISKYFRLFSRKIELNPKFYNWNKVILKYCDGTGYIGYKKDPLIINSEKLYFRGENITMGVLNLLKEKYNFKNSEKVAITGSSAGGLAALYWSNYIKEFINNPITKIITISDSSLFLDLSTNNTMKTMWKNILNIFDKEFISNSEKDCIYKNKERYKCFMAEYIIPNILFPTFIINSLYDSWELVNNLKERCFLSYFIFDNCNFKEKSIIDEHKNLIINYAMKNNQYTTYFLPSCFCHSFFYFSNSWEEIIINNKSFINILNNWIEFSFKDICLNNNSFMNFNIYLDNKWPESIQNAFRYDMYFILESTGLIQYLGI